MNIIVVDDSYPKVEIIGLGVKMAGIPIDNLHHFSNSGDAARGMSKLKYDVLFLDIQLPPSLGEVIEEDGGIKLLELVNVNPNIHGPSHVIAITSHLSTYNLYKDYFERKGWLILHTQLTPDVICEILTYRLSNAVDLDSYDVALITALEHTELQNVLKLPMKWVEKTYPNDSTIYHVGEFTTSNGAKKKIISASCARMGMVPAAALTSKLCLKFNPDYLFMSGICAGVPGKTNFGDIVVGDPVWDWGSGKLTIVDGIPTHLPSPHQISLDTAIRSKLMKISVEGKYLNKIYSDYSYGKRPSHNLCVKIAPLASGASVLEDSEIVGKIQKTHRDVHAIEMEAYGVMCAASLSGTGRTKVVVIKSVCDFANLDKNDDWQDYAAYTSSKYIYHIITNELY
ncbi:5'-methylthioadenosine/S-adenosylhomocysteine nucleosidase [Serratia proteamaculans]|uniref:phosphorylase family protein n=1 Tax=Serratia proteamaculans TaxID=28151 RepID=UPI00217BFFCB|nr:hypothetical protein [Serratia proteamaculans]CAI1882012.1 5'-methylthioadenosine/S-adenosylhomocysteine nucleosidase [Serratia proteamaculans]